MTMFLVPSMGRRRHGEENRCQKREDQRLDKSHEELQSQEWNRSDVRHQECDHGEQNLSGEDVTEETEGEGDDLRGFGDELEDPDEAPDGISPRCDEKFASIREDAERRDAEELCGKHGDDSDRKRHIHIRIHRSKERKIENLSGMFFLNRNAPDPRQNPHPVRKHKEEEDRCDERKEGARLLFIADDRVEESKETLHDNFKECLKPPRNFAVPRPLGEVRDGEDDEHREPRHDERVADFEGADMEDRFGGEGGGFDGGHAGAV